MTTTVDQLFRKAVDMGVAPATPEELSRALYEKELELRHQSEERWKRERQEWVRKILEPIAFKMPKRYQGYTSETLRAVCGPRAYKEKEEAVLLMASWAEDRLDRPGILLTGKPGTGKTALALMAIRERARRTGESVGLVRYMAFVGAVQATYSKGYVGPSRQQLIRAAKAADILLVDDWGENALSLGEGAANDKQNIWREILDHRNMNDLPTVIISNLTTARLQAQFGEDIISRLQEHCVAVAMNGVDLRKKGAVGW